MAEQCSAEELGYARDRRSIYSPRRLGSRRGRYCSDGKVHRAVGDIKPNLAALSFCELVDKVVEVNEVSVSKNIADVDFHLVLRRLAQSLYNHTCVFIKDNSDSTLRSG